MCLVTMVCDMPMARPAADRLPTAATFANTSSPVRRSTTVNLTPLVLAVINNADLITPRRMGHIWVTNTGDTHDRYPDRPLCRAVTSRQPRHSFLGPRPFAQGLHLHHHWHRRLLPKHRIPRLFRLSSYRRRARRRARPSARPLDPTDFASAPADHDRRNLAACRQWLAVYRPKRRLGISGVLDRGAGRSGLAR